MIFIKNKKFLQNVNFFNIGTNDKGIKVRDIVDIFLKATNYGTKAIFQRKKQGWVGDVVNYRYSTKKIKASQMIADSGNSEESSISLFSLDVNLLTGELNETEIIRNKQTNVKSMSNNFQALCKREDRSY